MEGLATLANALWSASNLPAALGFRRSLHCPDEVQQRRLRAYVQANRHTAFGRAHGFASIRTYEDFVRRVPLADYQGLEPWVDRIRRGEKCVLTREPVTHLLPTSGSSGARKLIPFTAASQREANAAIGPWLVDLQRAAPGVLAGPAYWSVTPVLRGARVEESAVPIGFDADTAYLGGARRRLAEAIMAVGPQVGRARSLQEFHHETLLHLLRRRELRLISVWHPSYLTLLLEALPARWEELLRAIADGRPGLPARPRRADELRALGALDPARLWPELRVISCWGEGAAAPAAAELRRRFPDASLQPKGLMATEAFVTLPFRGQYPVAVRSHFFEFIDRAGTVGPVGAVREGEEYEVVVTTGGGLWRYRLGDRVRVTGWVNRTPSCQFLGRAGDISDRFGEKLSEPFVAAALRQVLGRRTPRFALLAPEEDRNGWRYTLYLEGEAEPGWADEVDRALCENPHYAYCRTLGQLRPVRLFIIARGGFEVFAQRQAAPGARLGDLKPVALSSIPGWSKLFSSVEVRGCG